MSFEAFLARALLKLPDAMLVRMSGGEVVETAGRRLNPHVQYLAHLLRGRRFQPQSTPAKARASFAMFAAMATGNMEPGVTAQPVSIDTGERRIPARVYRPNNQAPGQPLFVFYHYGGGVTGDLETCHVFCSMISKVARCPVLSVDYRLAPEHKWPAGLNDAIDAYLWAVKSARSFGAAPDTAAVGGDSMGGCFAAIVCQEMKRRGLAQPAMQLLIYPAVDMASETPSMTAFADSFPLNQDLMGWYARHYLPEGADLNDVRISPLRAEDLSGLAPGVVITAGFDPLVDQGFAYAEKLKAAGVDTIYRCYDALPHAFTACTGVVPAADRACREICNDVARTLAKARA